MHPVHSHERHRRVNPHALAVTRPPGRSRELRHPEPHTPDPVDTAADVPVHIVKEIR